ncbi:hypothetical protein LWI29_031828 [Acer saccharum]|uniref:Transmembrane protein n=1 Tax=Acer saccharum TaxID=4024 RepID=A0AA39TB85_ACESA|nr:hypothetical protein LWI29_031828 [Acer saccharum]
MATTTASVAASLSPLPQPPPVSSIFKPKPCTTFFNTTHNKFTACCLSSRKANHLHNPISLGFPSKRYELWRRNATSGEVLPSESTPIDTSQQIVSSSTSGDGGTASTVVSVLLFIAFVALSILTIGVVYIAVTDFLQKREREKFEKEEATKKKKKGGKKMKVRAKAGPRGFGQKIDDDNEEEDDG